MLHVSSFLEAHVAVRVGADVTEGQRGRESASATRGGGGGREREHVTARYQQQQERDLYMSAGA